MRGQMYLVSAVIIVIFLVTIFTYYSLPPSYDINYKYQVELKPNWLINSTSRFVYVVYGYSNSHVLEFNFPYNFSSLAVFSKGPLAWQVDGNKIFVEDDIKASQHKVFYFYVNGTNYNFRPIYSNSNKYYLLSYYISLPDAYTYGNDKITFDCTTINSTGPVFVKFCGNYAFDDFMRVNGNVNLTAYNLTVDGTTYVCDGVVRTFNTKLAIFEGNYSMEFVNFNGTVNCTNNVWEINLSEPSELYITPKVDPYAYAYFGNYSYNVDFETVDQYFSNLLSQLSYPYGGIYNCTRKGGLYNNFGDLKINEPWINNSFIQWNTTDFYYDSMQIQNGTIKINGVIPSWFYYDDHILAQTTNCNATFYFFNMSPVIYVNLTGLCEIYIPIGMGNVSYFENGIVVKNSSYKVIYYGDILSNSTYPTIYAYNHFYIIIARDNWEKPYFYNFSSYCPRIS